MNEELQNEELPLRKTKDQTEKVRPSRARAARTFRAERRNACREEAKASKRSFRTLWPAYLSARAK